LLPPAVREALLCLTRYPRTHLDSRLRLSGPDLQESPVSRLHLPAQTPTTVNLISHLEYAQATSRLSPPSHGRQLCAQSSRCAEKASRRRLSRVTTTPTKGPTRPANLLRVAHRSPSRHPAVLPTLTSILPTRCPNLLRSSDGLAAYPTHWSRFPLSGP
jgi:hypothetical protein